MELFLRSQDKQRITPLEGAPRTGISTIPASSIVGSKKIHCQYIFLTRLHLQKIPHTYMFAFDCVMDRSGDA